MWVERTEQGAARATSGEALRNHCKLVQTSAKWCNFLGGGLVSVAVPDIVTLELGGPGINDRMT